MTKDDFPLIIVESSFLVTTGSGQGDKAKTEVQIKELITKHYKKYFNTDKSIEPLFIGFVDGAGWYARQSDLKRMIFAFDEVFTFHDKELDRFKTIVKQHTNKFSSLQK